MLVAAYVYLFVGSSFGFSWDCRCWVQEDGTSDDDDDDDNDGDDGDGNDDDGDDDDYDTRFVSTGLAQLRRFGNKCRS